jgi:hypothetical protein
MLGGWLCCGILGPDSCASLCVPLPFLPALPAAPFEFEFEDAQLTEQNVRDLVFEEMLYYHPDLAAPMAAAQPPIMHQKHFGVAA